MPVYRNQSMRVAVAFDHRGRSCARRILAELDELGHEPLDLGTDGRDVRVDYPDKARELGEAILAGEAERGILVCGSGVGASVAACKIAGIRAAICHDVYSAHQGVEHDDMNVLCLGPRSSAPSWPRISSAPSSARSSTAASATSRRLEKVEALEEGAHG